VKPIGFDSSDRFWRIMNMRQQAQGLKDSGKNIRGV